VKLDPPIPSSHATLERLDPLAAAAARPVTTGAALLALAVPTVMIAVRIEEITQPAWLVVSYAALFAAVWILLNRSHPTRPVWPSPSAQVFHVLLAVMLITSAASTLGANAMIRDDWGPIVVGILLVATTPYRPAREIALWTVVHSLACAVLGIVQAPFAASHFPTLTYAVVGSVAVAVMGFTAAAYARSLNHSTQLWQTRAWQAASAAALENRGAVARSVQQQRVSLLNREVVPYLQRILEAETVSDADRDEARRLADSIRSLLVADVERPWAELMLDELVAKHPRLNIRAHADDPDDLGGHAVSERRTLLRALAAISLERLAASELDLHLSAPEGALRVVWSVTTPQPLTDARRALRSMLELIRGVTVRSHVHERAGRLVVEFEYGY
jgi:hypothetical protein